MYADNDAEMTEQSDDDCTAPVGAPRGKRARRSGDYVRANGEVRDQVRVFLKLGKSNQEIAEILSLPIKTVNRAVGKIHSDRIHSIRERPDVEKGRLYHRLEIAAEKSLADQRVLDKENKVVEISPTAANINNVIKATAEQGKFAGLHAPVRSQSFSVTAQLVNPHAQQALVNDPEYSRLIMAMEERERAVLSQRPGHVPGAVHGIGQQEHTILPAAPGSPQPEDDGDRTGGDPSPGDVHAAEAREVGVPIEIFPGVVLRHLPRPEGDLGRL